MAEPSPLLRFGSTKYFIPLLAPLVSLNSTFSSKFLYSLLVIMSPPSADSAPPLERTINSPLSIFQPFSGKLSDFAPRQPSVVLPSQISFHPSAFSRSDS